ncbi:MULTISPECIES: ABC transporter substrate-binding protein [Protofrankia]|uniref:ABC transporter substrate-binding protein n=1 Tax=Protofrankia TaxID=2994361 RepID=UPI0009D24551|nr:MULTISPECIES: ABC transporter substrate-binding protein [Protofrankia]ONH35188.1 hypothetical protein BL254_12145 [Protofrankia sp. BMG5.30]
MDTRRRFLSLSAGSFVALFAGSAVSACGTGEDQAGNDGTPRPGGRLVFAEPTSPIGWDPQVGTEDVLGLILRPVFDSLVSETPDGRYLPWLATSWTVSDDGLTYTFVLREDVTFSDGTPFDANAVKVNFDRVVAPETKSRYAKSLLGPYKASTVLDSHRVEVTLSRPYSQFLHAVSRPYLGFHSPRALAEHPDSLGSGGQFTVSTGPYVFTSVVQGQQAVFTRREGYNWGPGTARHTGRPYLDGYTVQFVIDDQSRVAAATSGQIGIADQVPAAQLAGLRRQTSVTLISRDVPGSPYTYYLNTRRPLFRNADARRVILYGVDVASITGGLFQGQYQRAGSILSPSTRSYDDRLASSWGYDRARAERLLDSLGYTGRDGDGYRTKDGARFSLQFPFATANTTSERRNYDTAFQAELKKIGVEVVLTELDAPTYIKRTLAGDYDVSGLAWGGSDPSILGNLFSARSLVTQGGGNKAWVDDPELEALLDEASRTIDLNKQNDLYRRVQARVIDQAYGLPTYVAKRSLAVRPTVHGLEFDSAGWPFLYDVWASGA